MYYSLQVAKYPCLHKGFFFKGGCLFVVKITARVYVVGTTIGVGEVEIQWQRLLPSY